MSQHMQKTTTTTCISTYQHNGTKLVLTIYTCISNLFQQLRYYLCRLDFNSKAFKAYIFNVWVWKHWCNCFNLYLSKIGPVIFRSISFSEVSKYKAFDN